jgi:hypothetical protein
MNYYRGWSGSDQSLNLPAGQAGQLAGKFQLQQHRVNLPCVNPSCVASVSLLTGSKPMMARIGSTG